MDYTDPSTENYEEFFRTNILNENLSARDKSAPPPRPVQSTGLVKKQRTKRQDAFRIKKLTKGRVNRTAGGYNGNLGMNDLDEYGADFMKEPNAKKNLSNTFYGNQQMNYARMIGSPEIPKFDRIGTTTKMSPPRQKPIAGKIRKLLQAGDLINDIVVFL